MLYKYHNETELLVICSLFILSIFKYQFFEILEQWNFFTFLDYEMLVYVATVEFWAAPHPKILKFHF